MTKITAIHGGGDWTDASAEYLVIPNGVDVEEEMKKRREWYREEYCPALRALGRGDKHPEYVTLFDWLKRLGATEPSDKQLEIVCDD